MFEMCFAKIFRSVNEHGNFVQFYTRNKVHFLHSYVFTLKTFLFFLSLSDFNTRNQSSRNNLHTLSKINKCLRGIYFSADFEQYIPSQEFRYKLKHLLSMRTIRIAFYYFKRRPEALKGWLVDDQFQSVARIRGKSRTNTGSEWTTNGKKNALGSWDRIGSFSAILLNTNHSSSLKRPRVTTCLL